MDTIMPKIIRKTSPYLRRPQASVTRMMRDVTIALMPVTIFAIVKYGWTAVIIILLSILSMTITEYIYYQITDKIDGEKFKFKNKSFTLYNFSALTSGLIFGLILPDSTPWYTIIMTGSLGIILGKLVFGGLGQNIFNPAALARVLLIINFSVASYQVDTANKRDRKKIWC